MSRTAFLSLIAGFITLGALFACDGLDENYSTNPNHRLSFSADTLSFDTVFTSVGSATKQFMVYNRNDAPLNIERIIQASPATSGFHINVDGRKGDVFDNVRLAAGDSMFVFVEVNVNPTDKDNPLLIQDSILFTCNNVTQTVLLEACGQDVHMIKGGKTLTEDTDFTRRRPYLVYDSLVVARGVTLNIESGTTLYFHNKARLVVDGTLIAKGTRDLPVTFRGDRLDFVLDDQLPYDRTPGQWDGIVLRAESFDNVLEHAIVRNGSLGIVCEASEPSEPKLKLSNSQVTNMDGNALTAVNCRIEASNSELSNATAGVALLSGGSYSFTHCTLANYITAKSRRSLAQEGEPSFTLKILDDTADEYNSSVGAYPLTSATFDNCIVDGSYGAGKEIYILMGGAESEELKYRFNHCVLMMNAIESENFSDVVFVDGTEGSRMEYRMTGGRANKYMYDFRPADRATPCVDMADVSVAREFPTDRYGVDRFADEAPDAGAYEFADDTSSGD